jgi:hypothetical protein
MPSAFDPRDPAPVPVSDHDDARDRIQEMLDDDRNRWAWAKETLESIATFIDDEGRVTERQLAAVDNIYNSVARHR